MSLDGKIAWHWQPRSEAAVPRAVVAWGAVAGRLHARLAQLAQAHQGRLQATAGQELLVVLGEEADLPWVEGVAYAAPCATAPALWLPTLYAPSVPPELLMAAMLRQHARGSLLLWPTPAAVVPLDRQLPLSPAYLSHIAGHWQGSGH